MLQNNYDDKTSYEVSLYNRDVRALVKDNESHTYYGDHWADTQVQDVLARDETEALQLITERYPPEQGFIVQHVEPLETIWS